MKREQHIFLKTVAKIAVPVTLQALLQSSFSVVDQVMTGQLGSTSIAGIGLSSKFASIYSVLVAAIATVAGIMISQYIGKKQEKEINRSFFVNLLVALLFAFIFTCVSMIIPQQIMSIYSKDIETQHVAAGYLQIVSLTFLPMAIASILSTLLRCIEAAALPLYAGICAAVVNTGLNYVLIFGKFGFPALGVTGAAIATVFSQVVNCGLIFIFLILHLKKTGWKMKFVMNMNRKAMLQYMGMLLPILVCEFLWSLGENVYAGIYGHIGTEACAAMTLTTPIQVLMIGALSGVAQATGVIMGKTLGSREYEKAYVEAKKLMWYGLFGAILLSVLLIFFGKYYVSIYKVEEVVKITARQILFAFALVSPVKVLNMILGGGIIRSGGKTNYVMVIDFIGTWCFGVPLGFLTAFIFSLPIPYVYFILSLEECVRLGISLVVFRKKKWMVCIEGGESS